MYISVTPALGKLRQKDYLEFKTGVIVYIVCFSLAGATE